MKTKICRKCGRELQLEMFHKCSSSKDGLNSYCKDCVNAMQNEYRHKKTNPVEEKTDNPLEQFKPRELIDELRRRGYRGTLSYVYEIKL